MTSIVPQVTTIIPTYRRPQMLERAIRSALHQTYPHLRVAVYDNASCDKTAEVVARMMREDSRVTYHCHAENIGMVNNWNYGIQRVQTPFFSVLSDDDILLPKFYETTLAGFDRYPDAMFSAGYSIIFSEEHGSVRTSSMPHEGYYPPPEGMLAWLLPSHPCVSGNVFRREAVERFGLMQDTLANDWDLELRIAAQAPYVVSFEPCVIYIVHRANTTKVSPPDAWFHSYQTILNSLGAIPTLPAAIRERAQRQLHEHHTRDLMFRVGMVNLMRGNSAYAEAAAEALRRDYKEEKQAAALERAIVLYRRIPAVRLGFCAAYGVREAYYAWKTRTMERQYRGYLLTAGN